MAAPRILKPIRIGKGFEWRVTDRQLTLLLKRATTAQRGRARNIIQEALRRYSPKDTGRLSRSWTVLANLQGQIRIRSKVDYSLYQNVDSPRQANRGYIQRALAAAKIILVQALSMGETPAPASRETRRFGGVGDYGVRPATSFRARPGNIQARFRGRRG